MCDVLVVGAGPVGLTLASELIRHGVGCRIVERLHEPSPYCRAIGISPRTLEVFDDMGIVLDIVNHGLWATARRIFMSHKPPADVRPPALPCPYSSLCIPQNATERILAEQLRKQGAQVERGLELTALTVDEDAVQAQLRQTSSGEVNSVSCRFVVGCDGAHSTVRHQLKIAFDGDSIPVSFKLGDVHIAWDAPRGMSVTVVHPVPDGSRPPRLFAAIPLPEPGRYRVTLLDSTEHSSDETAATATTGSAVLQHGIQSETAGPTLDELQLAVDGIVADRPRLSDLRWSSVFRISMRLAQHYRRGRVFLAGDAAHIHPPLGGQGMNTGIQDAYNLAWKLALVIGGAAPASLLDSYEAERRPVGADVVKRTTATSLHLGQGQDRTTDEQAVDAQLAVSYRDTQWVCQQVGVSAAPAAGDRAPDVLGLTREGIHFPLRLFDVLRGTQHVLLAHLHTAEPDNIAPLSEFVQRLPLPVRRHMRLAIITASAEAAATDLPALPVYVDAAHAFPSAYGQDVGLVLVRPDGYVGWRGTDINDATLQRYLNTVFVLDNSSVPVGL